MTTESGTRPRSYEHPLRGIIRASVPLCAFETADPAATIRGCIGALNGKGAGIPMIQWDILSGWEPMNKAGNEVLRGYDRAAMELASSLKFLADKAKDGQAKDVLAFLHQAHRGIDRDGVSQGLWLLRDAWKAKGCCMVLLAPAITLPADLASDVIVVREELPDKETIGKKVDSIVADAKASPGSKFPDEYPKDKVVEGLSGLLSVFDVEQTLALSMRPDGIDLPNLWTRKIDRLRGQTGMEITIDNPRFDSLAGCANVKAEIAGFINGRQKPGVCVFMDEVEKAFGGAGTDLSGVSTNMLGQWLSWTQDNNVRGFLLAGIPGAGKTWTGRCAAGEAGVPFCKLSMADLKGSLVGQSEQQLRNALSAAKALAGDGSILMIASANWVDNLSPEVMGRFTMGTFFYDWPDAVEWQALWTMYKAKYGLTDKVPESKNWVGREIEVACWRAWQYQRPLVDVARNIAPSCISQKGRLDALRKSCSGRFLSANQPGMFDCMDEGAKATESGEGKRMIKFN